MTLRRAYIARNYVDGKTTKDALCRLKRHLARRFHHLLSQPVQHRNGIIAAVSAPRGDRIAVA